MNNNDFLPEALFKTKALQVCSPEEPFWYTSGKIGPYYINTHYLYGGMDDANGFLCEIESAVSNPLDLYKKLSAAAKIQYDSNRTYQKVIDRACEIITRLEYDIISGGERRDFFFSLILAKTNGCPHLSILKNGSAYISDPENDIARTVGENDLKGKKVLHIADLVTEASSYERVWLPAIKAAGATIADTLAIVDRDQGGREFLAGSGIKLTSLCRIGEDFFASAYEQGLISSGQLKMIVDFTRDPDIFMKQFLAQHPDFIEREIDKGGKNALRARLCMEMGYADISDGGRRQ